MCAMTVMTRRSELALAAILMRAMKSRGQCRNSRPTGAPASGNGDEEGRKAGRGRSGEIKSENKGGRGKEGGAAMEEAEEVRGSRQRERTIRTEGAHNISVAISHVTAAPRRAPLALSLGLGRFQFNQFANNKQGDTVSFPLRCVLSPFTDSSVYI